LADPKQGFLQLPHTLRWIEISCSSDYVVMCSGRTWRARVTRMYTILGRSVFVQCSFGPQESAVVASILLSSPSIVAWCWTCRNWAGAGRSAPPRWEASVSPWRSGRGRARRFAAPV